MERERGRDGRRMKTRPDLAEGGLGGWKGGRCCLEKGRERKKIRGRQAGGLGSVAVHVYVRERESSKQVCVVYVCVWWCACALALFLSFLCLTTEWGKKRDII